MNIFDQYGIKEVADMTLYSIHKKKDGSGELYYMPALYFDTLKISTVEKTAENVWAQGGLGNARLICWDFNKEINVSLEDALCTPASLSLCWDGVLNADWKDGEVEFNSDISVCHNPVNKISRMEKCFYPRQNIKNITISHLLPHLDRDEIDEDLGILKISSVVDGACIFGTGLVRDRSYRWKMVIESEVKSIAVVPDRFFDVRGQAYTIDWNRKVSVTSLPTYENYKDAIIYRINTCAIVPPKAKIIFDDFMENGKAAANDESASESGTKPTETGSLVDYLQNQATTSLFNHQDKDSSKIKDEAGSVRNDVTEKIAIRDGEYLAIIVDNEDNYHALIGKSKAEEYYAGGEQIAPIEWYQPNIPVETSQFKNIDMWIRFQSINELIYFLLTKYEDNIISIRPVEIDPNEDEEGDWAVDKQITSVNKLRNPGGKLWAYVNPRTMKPYSDDYWFSQGEPYYIKSLSFAPKNKKLKAHRIEVRPDKWAGMYMAVGETYIKDRDTGLNQRMQIKFPLCKIKTDQNLTLEADGEPVVFQLELEVARPKSGVMMEITSYEIAEKMIKGDNGCFYAVDGSTEVLSE